MANELHKPIRHKFLKRFVFAGSVDDIWGADLVDMQKMARKNSGYRYILMIIDVFSKYGWAVPLKKKTGLEVSEALHQIFKQNKCRKLWVDSGREFYNKDVRKLLKDNNVKI